VADERATLALIGAGRMGRMHLRALRDSTAVEITDVVDPVPAARESLHGAGVRLHASLAGLLAQHRPDGVLVAAPTDRHAAAVAEAIDAGLAVLCEKPAGLSSADVARTGSMAEQAGVPYQVAYWRRFVPAVAAVRQRLLAGDLGDLLHIVCAQWDASPPPPRFRRSSGGIFVDMGVHEFDVVRWISGEDVVDVRAAVTPALDESARPDADNAQALLTLTSGATAVVSLGRHHPPGDVVTLEVFGSAGSEHVAVLDPAEGDRAMLDALRLQAGSFARFLGGGVREGAGTKDAVAALADAERASACVGLPDSS
jgi:myo-inositol 2-dehydrogenase/D-chiro-inositol 1-dehydrogenase